MRGGPGLWPIWETGICMFVPVRFSCLPGKYVNLKRIIVLAVASDKHHADDLLLFLCQLSNSPGSGFLRHSVSAHTRPSLL